MKRLADLNEDLAIVPSPRILRGMAEAPHTIRLTVREREGALSRRTYVSWGQGHRGLA